MVLTQMHYFKTFGLEFFLIAFVADTFTWHCFRIAWSLRFWKCLTLFDGLLLFLGKNSLVFAKASIVQIYETLSNLEEVLIRLIGCEIDLEIEWGTSFNSLVLGLNSERILDPLLSSWIENIKEGPIYVDREWILVGDSQLFWFAYSSGLSKVEINKVIA